MTQEDIEKIEIIDNWLSVFPCKSYWKYPDAGCIHEHLTAEELYDYIKEKIK